ncbi:unnamed protein product [Didymodactylos carnosus]|uniref:Carboxylic ester hydrolase n=1 Tax=Didymodactylos carnosus TaxID=1234261 RepID=A0A814MPB7_9BILA|nr:unnamed protein product [Didymodactylos carnosus]CAF1080652.1 unnamed protein product [Didymodactylos carnosus]CAF3772721.1 unnamed protein product [Didymodactylos carnosus]CAF3846598.1 unnamed protein product [Didymodactylos carnosus]
MPTSVKSLTVYKRNVYNHYYHHHHSYTSDNELIRETSYGLVRGLEFKFTVGGDTSHILHRVHAWLGIPFAKPPIEQRRFRLPEPPVPWTNIYNATQLPATCWQTEQIVYNLSAEKIWSPNTVRSENCLYLNVWVPVQRYPKTKLAVLVWIYGGGFVTGTASLDIYDGRILSALNNVIVVSMQYRLQSFGFLYLGKPDAPGMYDQVLALEWIANNIQNFGGDSKRITLFGESAGAVSVGFHLLSPKSRSLFNSAILQSGGPTARWSFITQSEAYNRSKKFLHEFYSLVNNRLLDKPWESNRIPDVCKQSNTDDIEIQFQCALQYPVLDEEHYGYTWTNAEYTIQDGGPVFFLLMPVIDGTFLPQNPITMLKTGNFKKCPLLLGANRDEGSYFMVYATGNDKVPGNALPDVSYSTFLKHLELYYNYIPSYPYKVTMANTYSEASQDVFFYYFIARPSVSDWHQWTGVMHADEIMFIFGEPLNHTDQKNYTTEEVQLSKRIMSYWSNFAKYDDPNGNDTNIPYDWPKYSYPARQHIVLDTNSKTTGVALRAEYCAFWEEYVPTLLEEFGK